MSFSQFPEPVAFAFDLLRNIIAVPFSSPRLLHRPGHQHKHTHTAHANNCNHCMHNATHECVCSQLHLNGLMFERVFEPSMLIFLSCGRELTKHINKKVYFSKLNRKYSSTKGSITFHCFRTLKLVLIMVLNANNMYKMFKYRWYAVVKFYDDLFIIFFNLVCLQMLFHVWLYQSSFRRSLVPQR